MYYKFLSIILLCIINTDSECFSEQFISFPHNKINSKNISLHIKKLLKDGVDPNKLLFDAPSGDEYSLLCTAVMYHDHDLVEQLLKAGADPNKEGTCVYLVKPDEKVIGKRINPPLFEAIMSKDYEMVEILLNAGADPKGPSISYHAKGTFLIQPLYFAAVIEHVDPDIIKLLLNAGADPNWVVDGQEFWKMSSDCDWEGDPCFLGTRDMISMISWPPLIHAIEDTETRNETVALLLNAGANPNIICSGNIGEETIIYSPLSLAIEYKNIGAIKLLLNAGADPYQEWELNGKTITPFSLALENKNRAIADLLLVASFYRSTNA